MKPEHLATEALVIEPVASVQAAISIELGH
jgi:hypothetical protein